MPDKTHWLLHNASLKVALLRLRPQVFTLSNTITQLPCVSYAHYVSLSLVS